MSRRCKTLRIGSHFFASVFGPGAKSYEVIKDGLPTDAVVVGATMSPKFDSVVLLVQSDQFKDIPEGDCLPEIEPTLTQPKSEQTVLENARFSEGHEPLFTTRHDFTETYPARVDNYHDLARGFCDNPEHRLMAGYRAVAVDIKPWFSTAFGGIEAVDVEVTYRHVSNIVKPKTACS